jgi:hypothetical protein
MVTMKKYFILFLFCFVGIFIILVLLPIETQSISNAVVNPNNGDIVFCYADYVNGVHVTRVVMYNKEGEELFLKTFMSEWV